MAPWGSLLEKIVRTGGRRLGARMIARAGAALGAAGAAGAAGTGSQLFCILQLYLYCFERNFVESRSCLISQSNS